MRTIPSNAWQNHTRWILIFGLLAGLFFSSGEGVQLFPFPISEGNNAKNASTIFENSQKSYAFSVHNSGGHLPTLQSKFQKQANQYLPVGHLTFGWSSLQANFCLKSAHNREEANFSRPAVFPSSQSDRAPPVI
jgi:hypothetical protein